MLDYALSFFIFSILAAVFAFASPACKGVAQVPPQGWSCPEGWTCAPSLPMAAPKGFVCPDGWDCVQRAGACGATEIAKILFVVFVVLFLVSLVAGLLRRP